MAGIYGPGGIVVGQCRPIGVCPITVGGSGGVRPSTGYSLFTFLTATGQRANITFLTADNRRQTVEVKNG